MSAGRFPQRIKRGSGRPKLRLLNLPSADLKSTKTARPGLDKCLQALQPGDTLLVWRVDRLGRSIRHLIDLVEHPRERGVGFKSLSESIDTTTANGKLICLVALTRMFRANHSAALED